MKERKNTAIRRCLRFTTKKGEKQMSQTAANVSAAKPNVGGAVNVAPANTTLPTDATTALAAAFKSLGYISEDGLSNEGIMSPDVVKAWGGDVVLTLNANSEDAVNFKLIEITNVDVLKFVFGEDNVSGTLATGIAITVNDKDRPEQVMVIDMILRDGALKRIVIPKAVITEIGEISYADSDAVGYEVTVQANKDADGNTHYEYISATGATGATNG